MHKPPLAAQIAAWQSGLQSEIAFWDNWFATRGHLWPEDFRVRADPTSEFPPSLFDLLGSNFAARILDVGAGPMTALGCVRHGQSLNITACDPLAPAYDEIADRHGIVRPIKTQQAFAEDLTAYYEANTFDLVYCQNALDHSFDPVRGIEEMLWVAKIGGHIVLQHSTNEAEYENYFGLHQWNFDADGDHFIIWNKNSRINASDYFADAAEIAVKKDGRSHRVVAKKVRDLSGDLGDRARTRLRLLLAELTSAAAT